MTLVKWWWVKTLVPSEPQNSWFMAIYSPKYANKRFWPIPKSHAFRCFQRPASAHLPGHCPVRLCSSCSAQGQAALKAQPCSTVLNETMSLAWKTGAMLGFHRFHHETYGKMKGKWCKMMENYGKMMETWWNMMENIWKKWCTIWWNMMISHFHAFLSPSRLRHRKSITNFLGIHRVLRECHGVVNMV